MVFPGIQTGVCSEVSYQAGVAGETRLVAHLFNLSSCRVAAAEFDPDDLVLYFRWKRQMPE